MSVVEKRNSGEFQRIAIKVSKDSSQSSNVCNFFIVIVYLLICFDFFIVVVRTFVCLL